MIMPDSMAAWQLIEVGQVFDLPTGQVRDLTYNDHG